MIRIVGVAKLAVLAFVSFIVFEALLAVYILCINFKNIDQEKFFMVFGVASVGLFIPAVVCSVLLAIVIFVMQRSRKMNAG